VTGEGKSWVLGFRGFYCFRVGGNTPPGVLTYSATFENWSRAAIAKVLCIPAVASVRPAPVMRLCWAVGGPGETATVNGDPEMWFCPDLFRVRSIIKSVITYMKKKWKCAKANA